MFLSFRRLISTLLIVCLAGLGLPVHAGMLPTQAGAGGNDRSQVLSILDRQEVRAGLEARGVSPAEVKARVAAMSDDEVAQLAGQLESLPAGGADVLGVLLVVFIVLLITDILGFTKIFPFTRSVR
ncbi:MAG TPA: PA2779 family protein [Burkholderiales bacterium]|nr:PA2779 family protein [Burkholderiales bacterium]